MNSAPTAVAARENGSPFTHVTVTPSPSSPGSVSTQRRPIIPSGVGRHAGSPPIAYRKVSKPGTRSDCNAQLSPLAFHITREAGTERAFTGAYWNLHDKGLFRCVCCDTALFSSAAKFDSGTGWPSFWQPMAEENVHHGKPSGGYTDSEVTCIRCDAHLGDLFDDGPRPTGLRYCIDSVALRFVKS